MATIPHPMAQAAEPSPIRPPRPAPSDPRAKGRARRSARSDPSAGQPEGDSPRLMPADPYSEAAYRARYVHEKFSVAMVAAALRRAMGGIHAAARGLNCSRTTVRRYVQEYPALQEVIDSERQLAVDLAERALFVSAAAGEPWAVQYLLSTQGRDRGYVTRRELAGPPGQPFPGPPDRVVVVGDREKYLEKLRRISEEARGGGQNASRDGAAGPVPERGPGNNGNATS